MSELNQKENNEERIDLLINLANSMGLFAVKNRLDSGTIWVRVYRGKESRNFYTAGFIFTTDDVDCLAAFLNGFKVGEDPLEDGSCETFLYLSIYLLNGNISRQFYATIVLLITLMRTMKKKLTYPAVSLGNDQSVFVFWDQKHYMLAMEVFPDGTVEYNFLDKANNEYKSDKLNIEKLIGDEKLSEVLSLIN